MLNVQELKVGDRVGVSNSSWDGRCEIKTVSKRTATQVVLDDGSRWTKRGTKIGQGGSYWHRAFLVTEADASERNKEAQIKQKRNALLARVRDLKFSEVTNDGLLVILQVAAHHSFSSR